MAKTKVDQILDEIKNLGINAFDDEALAKLLSLLDHDELELFEILSLSELDYKAYCRISNVKNLLKIYELKEVMEFKNSSIFSKYVDALASKTYMNFFSESSTQELARLKRFVAISTGEDEVSKRASSKIQTLIKTEIRRKEANKKLTFIA